MGLQPAILLKVPSSKYLEILKAEKKCQVDSRVDFRDRSDMGTAAWVQTATTKVGEECLVGYIPLQDLYVSIHLINES